MKTVYVGMSGGVDSSVSAALLKEQGFRVVGVYMKNWTQDVAGVACPWKSDLADARATAAVLDIPFKVFDFQTEYKQHVVDLMVDEYRSGRTPNPDILCNQEIKFKLFLETALADGADFIATGHYANTDGKRLLMARDSNKDQTYFLYRVTSRALAHTIFPLSALTKPEVRKLADRMNLPTATKPDSQGICFIGEVGIKEFLRQYVDVSPGDVIDQNNGKSLGRHEGAIYYTIGQRHGLGLGGGTPYYVTGKDMITNTVYVTTDSNDQKLDSSSFNLIDTHWIGQPPLPSKTYQFRSRHRAALINSSLKLLPDGNYSVTLESPERAVTPGQSAVFYDQTIVMGGGMVA
jgi:tRNA-specific 2-thiouridylase